MLVYSNYIEIFTEMKYLILSSKQSIFYLDF